VALEAEIVRLLEAPRGATLRFPALQPQFRKLLHAVCSRFNVQDEDRDGNLCKPVIKVSANAASTLPMPIQAFVPGTWAGASASSLCTARELVPVKMKGYMEMETQPGHDFQKYSICSPRDARRDMDGSYYTPHRLGVDWELVFRSANADGVVITAQVDMTPSCSGVAIALCSQSGEAKLAAPAYKLLAQDLSGENCTLSGEGPYIVLVHRLADQQQWQVECGLPSQLFTPESLKSQIMHKSSGMHFTLWISASEVEHGVIEVAAGIDCFPWQKLLSVQVRSAMPRFAYIATAGNRDDSATSPSSAAAAFLRTLCVEEGLCADKASREHIVFLRGHAEYTDTSSMLKELTEACPSVLPWKPGVAIALCQTPAQALELSRRATRDGWKAFTLATAHIDKPRTALGEYPEGKALKDLLSSRAKVLHAAGVQIALELGLTEWVKDPDREGLVDPTGIAEGRRVAAPAPAASAATLTSSLSHETEGHRATRLDKNAFRRLAEGHLMSRMNFQ